MQFKVCGKCGDKKKTTDFTYSFRKKRRSVICKACIQQRIDRCTCRRILATATRYNDNFYKLLDSMGTLTHNKYARIEDKLNRKSIRLRASLHCPANIMIDMFKSIN